MSDKETPKMVDVQDSSKVESPGSVFDINEKALEKRIYYRIFPLMFCYLTQFLDKVIINVSRSRYPRSRPPSVTLKTVCQRDGPSQGRQVERERVLLGGNGVFHSLCSC